MKAIICGCGYVGKAIATYLFEEKHQVTIIDTDAEKLKKAEAEMDIQTIVGEATSPEVLERAEAKDADLIIAVTRSDEVNMMICFVAFRLFNIPMKIARVRSGFYFNGKYSPFWDELHIDVVISPEKEIAKTILRNLKTAGALEFISLQNKSVFIGAKCLKDAPFEKMKIEKINKNFPEYHICIAGILRDCKSLDVELKTAIQADDEVYLITDMDHYELVLEKLGHPSSKSKHVIVVGGGRIGLALGHLMEEAGMDNCLSIVEKNEETATFLATQLSNASIVNGDALDEGILNEVCIDKADALVALTQEDEDNILLSLLAKQHGVPRTFSLINKPLYNNMLSNLGVDVIINPNAISTSTILQYIRKGQVRSIYALKAQIGDLMEFEVLETSKVAGAEIGKIRKPKSVKFCAVVRQGQLLEMTDKLKIKSGDNVIVLAKTGQFKAVEKLFAAGLYFF